MHKWCDQRLFTSGRRRSQADRIYRYAQKPAIHTMIFFTTQFEPSWMSGNTKYQGLSLLQRGCQLFWIWPESLRCSLVNLSSNIQFWCQWLEKVLEASCEAQQWFHFWKKSGMCFDIRHDWLLHTCLQVSALCSPNFRREKKASKLPCFDTNFAPL